MIEITKHSTWYIIGTQKIWTAYRSYRAQRLAISFLRNFEYYVPSLTREFSTYPKSKFRREEEFIFLTYFSGYGLCKSFLVIFQEKKAQWYIIHQLRLGDEGWYGPEHIKSFYEETTTDFAPWKEEVLMTSFLKASGIHKEEEDTEVRAPMKTLLWPWLVTLDSDPSDPLLHTWILLRVSHDEATNYWCSLCS